MKSQSAFLCEIIGPCGAGKSTLAELLRNRNSLEKEGTSIWGLPGSLLAKSAVTAFPTMVRMGIANRAFRTEHFRQVIRLKAFTGFVKSRDYPNGSFFFDEGAVFAFSKLRVDCFDQHAAIADLEKRNLDEWKSLLKAIIWLDAEDDLLIKRIRERDKAHRMKERPESEIIEFLERYRNAFRAVTGKLSENGNVKLMKFDTGNNCLEDIADEITSKIKAKNASRKEVLPIQSIEVGYEDVYF